jgi:hypothetical protein
MIREQVQDLVMDNLCPKPQQCGSRGMFERAAVVIEMMLLFAALMIERTAFDAMGRGWGASNARVGLSKLIMVKRTAPPFRITFEHSTACKGLLTNSI